MKNLLLLLPFLLLLTACQSKKEICALSVGSFDMDYDVAMEKLNLEIRERKAGPHRGTNYGRLERYCEYYKN